MKNLHYMCFAQDFSSNNQVRHNFNFKAWFFSGILKIQSRWEEEEKKKFWQTCLLSHFIINILLSSAQRNKTHVIQQKIDQKTLNILSILSRLGKENESLPLETIYVFPCLNISTFQMSQWSKLQFWKVCESRDWNPRCDWGHHLPREMWQKNENIYAVQGVELNGSLKKLSSNVISTVDPDSIC